MRTIAFAAAAVMAATTVQAQADWMSQRFPEAGFSAEAPVTLAAMDSKTENGVAIRSYGASAGPMHLIVATGDHRGMPGAERWTADYSTNAEIDAFLKGFEGIRVISRSRGPAANQTEVTAEFQGMRFRVRSTFKYPWNVMAIAAWPASQDAAYAPQGARFINGIRVIG